MRKKFEKRVLRSGKALFLATSLTLLFTMPDYAAGSGASIVTNGFNQIYTIIAALVSSIGTLLLLWGLFEWAQSLNTQDGGAQSMAFKRIASGLVATLGPKLVPIINSSIGKA